MTIRRFPLEAGRGPLEAPEPDGVIRTSIGLFERFRGQIQKKTDSQLVRRVLGCDGRSVVTAYRGDCQDDARAINGGGAALGVDLGNGVIVPVAADLGRSYVASSGYQGDGLASGAFPAPVAPTAGDLNLDPIDQAGGVAISGEAADPGADALGATVAGKVGDSKRLAVCYDSDGVGIWDDIISGSETAVSGLSNVPNYIGALGAGRYALTELYGQVVSLIEAGAETSTTNLPSYTGDGNDYAYSAVAISRDLDTMAVLVRGPHSGSPSAGKAGIYIGTSMQTTPSWAVINLDVVCDFQVYGTRSMAFDSSGRLWVAAQTLSTQSPRLLVIDPPYSSVSRTLVPSWTGSLSWSDPSPLAISRDGRYVATGVHYGGLVDIWSTASTSRLRTLTLPGGYSRDFGYGGIAWGPDGRLFVCLKRTSDDQRFLAVWVDLAAAPELIDLGTTVAYGYDWVSASGDGQVVAVTGSASGAILLVEPPYTGAGAVVTTKTLSYNIAYQFEFDPSEAYLDADLTLSADVTTADVAGQLQSTIRLDYRNEDLVTAFGITVTLPVAGRSVVSVSDDGIYDSAAGIIRWFLPLVTTGGSGYVTATLRVR